MLINLSLEELKNTINDKHIFSVKFKVLDRTINREKEYFYIFQPENREVKFLVENFTINHEYIIIYSIIQLGKQIEKQRYEFKYPIDVYNKFKINKNISVISEQTSNNLRKVTKLEEKDINKYMFIDVNPISIIRNKNSEIEIYVNGSILYLKKDLYKIVLNLILGATTLYSIKNTLKISALKLINDVELLRQKYCF